MIFGTIEEIRFTVSSVKLSSAIMHILENAFSMKGPCDRPKQSMTPDVPFNSVSMLRAYVSQSQEDGSKLVLKVKVVSLTNFKEHVSS